ncbi:hypothetical protein JTE90_010965 [Oedothorax gibbosus]|uniref:Uncharacterized protein n=1 Tax=Oedothorax gibbosus TaxID=931172 RepID=A0AAV6TN60_9ARAC|nr:hypothetical protein JTE90_010965 [Oedothorax gibbosus]
MTRRCDSNPAQYERNRRFGHLVHVLGREASGAKLPSRFGQMTCVRKNPAPFQKRQKLEGREKQGGEAGQRQRQAEGRWWGTTSQVRRRRGADQASEAGL